VFCELVSQTLFERSENSVVYLVKVYIDKNIYRNECTSGLFRYAISDYAKCNFRLSSVYPNALWDYIAQMHFQIIFFAPLYSPPTNVSILHLKQMFQKLHWTEVIAMATKLIHANPKMVKKLRIVAVIKGITLQQATNDALDQYIRRHGGDRYDTTC
jgi:hypothetical protein